MQAPVPTLGADHLPADSGPRAYALIPSSFGGPSRGAAPALSPVGRTTALA